MLWPVKNQPVPHTHAEFSYSKIEFAGYCDTCGAGTGHEAVQCAKKHPELTVGMIFCDDCIKEMYDVVTNGHNDLRRTGR